MELVKPVCFVWFPTKRAAQGVDFSPHTYVRSAVFRMSLCMMLRDRRTANVLRDIVLDVSSS